jgi:hypothetical protein
LRILTFFNYSFPAPPNPGDYSISASGTLTVGNENPIGGGFPILSITGTRPVDGVDIEITGFLPPFGLTEFDRNDNSLFYPGRPFLDFNGFSFMVDNPSLSDDGLGDVNARP